MSRPRVLVIGGGPAGLSAGVHLLEAARGRIDVELISMGHHLGGKAASWRDPQGYVIDHGFHAIFGFYEEMKALLRRAGVDLSKALIKSNGEFRFYDERTRRLERFDFAHNPLVMMSRYARFPGLTFSERLQLGAAFTKMARTLANTPALHQLDDVCYRAFLRQHGVPASVMAHPMLREVHELAFNHPYEISTYIVLRWAQLAGHCYHDATFHYGAGSFSEQFWDPIARYFERLGGTIRVRQKLIGLEHSEGRLTGLRFAVPENVRVHPDGKSLPPAEVPVAAGTHSREDRFAAVISTLPAACFLELNPGDELWQHPFFAGMHNLTSVSTLSLQLWLREQTPGRIDGSIATLPLPLGYVIDYKRLVPEFTRDRRYGAALEWVGGEVGYESMSDEELIANARAELGKVPGFIGTDRAQVVHASLRRNRSNHNRYLLTDPGTWRFRPTVKTPLERLFLAGDWVRNDVETPSMEGAIRCGKEAAQAVLRAL
jgi:uncharacterized protein with NAD-binding domain and iron-sulfur cluster